MQDIEFSLLELKSSLDARNKSYSARQIKRIIADIKSAVVADTNYVWVTFFWDDGDYSEIIKFFEDRGVSVGSPTSPWEGGSTSFVFSWDLKDHFGVEE